MLGIIITALIINDLLLFFFYWCWKNANCPKCQEPKEIKRVFTGWKKLCQTCEDQQKKQVEIF